MLIKQVAKCFLSGVASVAVVASASATVVEFDFFGNAGFGLLPGNEIGANTATADTSDAFGGEVGDGLVYNTQTNVLSFDFEFSGLTGGLFNAASGIHFHNVGANGELAADPLNGTGGIDFNLNTGTDPNVTLETEIITAFGIATAARVTGTALLTEAQEVELFNGDYYLNIHSGGFTGGELRGNIVAVPEPVSAALLSSGLLLLARRRRA